MELKLRIFDNDVGGNVHEEVFNDEDAMKAYMISILDSFDPYEEAECNDDDFDIADAQVMVHDMISNVKHLTFYVGMKVTLPLPGGHRLLEVEC